MQAPPPRQATWLAKDDQRACRLALGPRLLLRKAITPAPAGRVTAWATKQSRATRAGGLSLAAHCDSASALRTPAFGRRAGLHPETAGPRRLEQSPRDPRNRLSHRGRSRVHEEVRRKHSVLNRLEKRPHVSRSMSSQEAAAEVQKSAICRSFLDRLEAGLGAHSRGYPRIPLGFRHSRRLVPEPGALGLQSAPPVVPRVRMTGTELHRPADELPEESLEAAAVLRRAGDPVMAKLDAAPATKSSARGTCSRIEIRAAALKTLRRHARSPTIVRARRRDIG
jgi:hypothetical protein